MFPFVYLRYTGQYEKYRRMQEMTELKRSGNEVHPLHKKLVLTNEFQRFIIAFNITKAVMKRSTYFLNPQRENGWCKFS